RNPKVDVCWSVGMAPGRGQHLADRAVAGDRVRRRLNGPESKAAVGIGAEPRPQSRFIKIGTLNVVIAVLVRMPDVNDGVRQACSIRRFNGAFNVQRLTLKTLR